MRKNIFIVIATFFAVCLTALVLASIALPAILMAEQRATDIRSELSSPTLKSKNNMIIIGVTETTLEKFPYRSPVDRAFLADLLQRIEERGAKAVGVDFIFDQPTEPEKDEKLAKVIRELKIPTSIAYPPRRKLTEGQQLFLGKFVPTALRGHLDVAFDGVDGSAREIFPKRIMADGNVEFGFAGLLASRLGIDVPSSPTRIAWRLFDPPIFTLSAHLVSSLPTLSGKIVLVGILNQSDDQLRTPLSAVNGESISGIKVQAQALATLLDRPPSPIWPEWVMLCLSVAGIALGALTNVFFPVPLFKRLAFFWTEIALFWLAAIGAWCELGIYAAGRDPYLMSNSDGIGGSGL